MSGVDVPKPNLGDHVDFVELASLRPMSAWVTDLIKTSHGRAFIGTRLDDRAGDRCWGYLAQITAINGEEMP